MSADPRRSIPGLDTLLELERAKTLVETYGRDWTVERLREVLDQIRSGSLSVPDSPNGYLDVLSRSLEAADILSLGPVINATGVVLHTNLGRAPLAQVARDAMAQASGYGNLEFDLAEGRRGSRYDHCREVVLEAVGGEDALVVNNNAAAVALSLACFARDKEVLVSHGELIEIGGGFRIPEVIEGAGARMKAVGTTNRTRIADYAKAIAGGGVGAILKVHRSNFEVRGFTEEASLEELSALAKEHGIPMIHDLGSGLLVHPSDLNLPAEPMPVESLAAGTDVVAFSGDKLLGGPQAGILVGAKEWIAPLRRHPLCRAFRVDKATLAALEATIRLYRDPQRALADIPTLRMLREPQDSIAERATALLARLPESLARRVHLVDGASVVGGGTYPGHEIPTTLLRIDANPTSVVELSAKGLAARLRSYRPPVVTRTRDESVLVDLRTVSSTEEGDLIEALIWATQSGDVGSSHPRSHPLGT